MKAVREDKLKQSLLNGTCGLSVIPTRDWSAQHASAVAKKRGADVACECLSPEVEIRGWFLPPEEQPVFGIRAIVGERVFVARRKHLRPEVLAEYPERQDAVFSGFVVNCHLRRGWNTVEFQFKDASRRWHTFQLAHLRLPYLWQIVRRLARRAVASPYELWTVRHGDPGPAEMEAMRDFLEQFPRRPLISVLMPVYNTPPRWLRRAIESVRAQIYPHWELCIADDCSRTPAVRALLEGYAQKDPRIKVCFRETNGHICETSNSALAMCGGEFTALLDHDDELPAHALFHVAWEAAQQKDVALIFSDEDKLDVENVRADPYFKPGWNYDLLLGQNCVSHLGAFRTSLMREVGGFRPGLEGSQDWDLTLRVIEKAGLDRVRHIPRVLYHWRTLETSTASSMEAKPYAAIAGRRAVQEHLARMHPGAGLEDTKEGGWRVVWPTPAKLPRVSVIVPTKDQTELLAAAIDSLLIATDYPDMEIVIIDHESTEQATRDYLKRLQAETPHVKCHRVEGPFNWSALNNAGVKHATGEILAFLNNDVDFCLRLRSLGLRNIYTPHAKLIHHESSTRRVWSRTVTAKLPQPRRPAPSFVSGLMPPFVTRSSARTCPLRPRSPWSLRPATAGLGRRRELSKLARAFPSCEQEA